MTQNIRGGTGKRARLDNLMDDGAKIAGLLEEERRIRAMDEAIASKRRGDKNAFYDNNDDYLYFYDYYKMCCSVFSYPNGFLAINAVVIGGIYLLPLDTELVGVDMVKAVWKWPYFVVLLLVSYLIPFCFCIIRAFRLKSTFKMLPFPVEGIGKLVHRCNGIRYLRRCSIRLELNYGKGDLPKEELENVKKTILTLIGFFAKKVMFEKAIYHEDSWRVQGNELIGFANWECCKKIIDCLDKMLSPLQDENAGIIKSVQIDFPNSKNPNDDFYIWQSEGD